MTDVIVVGAGVVGAAVTRALARAGAAVTLLDAHRIGGGTSRASLAWVNANQKTPRAYFDLNMAGMRAHERYAAEHPAPVWLHAGGNLEWVIDAAAGAQLGRKLERLRDWGYRAEEISVAELRELEPYLRVQDDARVVFYPDERWVDPVRLAASLVSDAEAAGAQVVTASPVASMEVASGRVGAVVTADHVRRSADAVVNCAGPAASRVAALAGASLPMANVPGLMAYTEPVAALVTRVMHTPKLQIRPDGGGRLLLNAESQDALMTADGVIAPTHPSCATLLSLAQEVVPALSGTRIEAARAAVRPVPADGLSVVGWHAEADNLYTVTTHSGVTLCLALAEHCAAEVVEGRTAAELASFRPDRFAA